MLLAATAAAVALLVVGMVVAQWGRGGHSGSDQPTGSAAPLPDGLPPTGVVLTPEDALALSAAMETLIAECMAARGFDYQLPTTDELIAGFGEWQPHAVLGIQRAGAARRIGYHSSGDGGRGTSSQASAYQLMELREREAYSEALFGPDVPPATSADDGQGASGG